MIWFKTRIPFGHPQMITTVNSWEKWFQNVFSLSAFIPEFTCKWMKLVLFGPLESSFHSDPTDDNRREQRREKRHRFRIQPQNSTNRKRPDAFSKCLLCWDSFTFALGVFALLALSFHLLLFKQLRVNLCFQQSQDFCQVVPISEEDKRKL